MIKLRNLEESDLEEYGYWNLPQHKYHLFNGPYFKKDTDEKVNNRMLELKNDFSKGIENPLPNKKIISDQNNALIGEVMWRWRSKETCWMEVGIVIFNEENWTKGIGYKALKIWIGELFEKNKEMVRIGLTTWSGNKGMMNLALKLNMKKEAVYRMARIVDGEYYDSISYGILREEWYDKTITSVS